MKIALTFAMIYAAVVAGVFAFLWLFTSFAWWELQDISTWAPERRGITLGASMFFALPIMAGISAAKDQK